MTNRFTLGVCVIFASLVGWLLAGFESMGETTLATACGLIVLMIAVVADELLRQATAELKADVAHFQDTLNSRETYIDSLRDTICNFDCDFARLNAENEKLKARDYEGFDLICAMERRMAEAQDASARRHSILEYVTGEAWMIRLELQCDRPPEALRRTNSLLGRLEAYETTGY